METTQIYKQQTAAEISYKAIKDAMKSAIKELEVKQVEANKGRKSTERSTQSLSQSEHSGNRYELRHNYIAYHQFRTENSEYKKQLSPTKDSTVVDQKFIDKIKAKYATKTVHLNQG